jgi:hypothetical protein
LTLLIGCVSSPPQRLPFTTSRRVRSVRAARDIPDEQTLMSYIGLCWFRPRAINSSTKALPTAKSRMDMIRGLVATRERPLFRNTVQLERPSCHASKAAKWHELFCDFQRLHQLSCTLGDITAPPWPNRKHLISNALLTTHMTLHFFGSPV